MNELNILEQLKESIKHADSIKIEYGMTAQQLSNEKEPRLITVSSNTIMEVDYIQCRGSIATLTGSFEGSTTTTEVFENGLDTITQSDTNSQTIKSSIIKMSKEDYDNLFKPEGKLYPMEFDELIPVEAEKINNNTIICIPSQKFIDSIPGYIRSHFTLEKKEDNLFFLTMIMSQKEECNDIVLMQYCNTKVEIFQTKK